VSRFTRSEYNSYDSLRRGLVGAWCPSVSGANGVRLNDLSGQQNHGTLTNMASTAWQTSEGKGALSFVNQFNVQLNRVDANSFALANLTAFTFSGWGLLTSRSASFGNGFFSWGNIGIYTSDCFLFVDGSGPLCFQVNNGADGGGVTTSNFPLGSWSHVAAVFNGTGTGNSGRMQILVNGNSQALTFGGYIVPTSTSAATGTVFRIGAYLDSTNSTAFQWNGQLDDIRIYNRALSPSEIQLLYTGGRGVGLRENLGMNRRRYAPSATAPNRRPSSRYLCFPG
jgi:hypothetical protein